MAGHTINSGVIARVAPQLERFINRQILGIEPDPDHWPIPHDVASLSVNGGFTLTDEAGPTMILGCEFTPKRLRRRTVTGAHAYRFEENLEYDCGWRLCDAAARFIRREMAGAINYVTTVPPPDTFGQVRVLPWLAQRLANLLQVDYLPNLFVTSGPLAVHPDLVRRPALPLAEMFRLNPECPARLDGARILLIDWRRHSGRTLLTLTRMLRRKGAEVARFAWLG